MRWYKEQVNKQGKWLNQHRDIEKAQSKSRDQLVLQGSDRTRRNSDVWSPQGPHVILCVWSVSVEWAVGRMGQEKAAEKTAGAGAQREVLKSCLMGLDLIQRKYGTH